MRRRRAVPLALLLLLPVADGGNAVDAAVTMAAVLEARGGHLRPADFADHASTWTEPVGMNYLGHRLDPMNGWLATFGGAQTIYVHPTSGALMTAADARREAYALAY